MLSVEIHRDLTRYRAKVVGGLTARSLACTAAALATGVAVWCLLTWALGLPFEEVSILIYASTIPLWALGFLEPQGMRPERWLPLWLRQHGRRARLAYGTRELCATAFGACDLTAMTATTATSDMSTTTPTKGVSHGDQGTTNATGTVARRAWEDFARRAHAVERWEPGRDA